MALIAATAGTLAMLCSRTAGAITAGAQPQVPAAAAIAFAQSAYNYTFSVPASVTNAPASGIVFGNLDRQTLRPDEAALVRLPVALVSLRGTASADAPPSPRPGSETLAHGPFVVKPAATPHPKPSPTGRGLVPR